jgi:hypothetical protein
MTRLPHSETSKESYALVPAHARLRLRVAAIGQLEGMAERIAASMEK